MTTSWRFIIYSQNIPEIFHPFATLIMSVRVHVRAGIFDSQKHHHMCMLSSSEVSYVRGWCHGEGYVNLPPSGMSLVVRPFHRNSLAFSAPPAATHEPSDCQLK